MTKATFDQLADDAKLGGPNKQSMWKYYYWPQINKHQIHSSRWRWSV
jgi:hypothetical protein